jgi:small-conductance mechanosensitive channel
LVKSILLEAADGVENILNDPKPSVNFKRFGETSLEFRLFVWTANPRMHALISSDVLFRVEEMFRDRGIVRTQTAKLAMIVTPTVGKDVTGDD